MVILRRLLLALAASILLLVVVGLAAWRFLAPPLLANAIDAQAGGLGIDLEAVAVESVGPDWLVLTDVATAGDGVVIDRAVIRFDSERLVRERAVESVRLEGVRIAATLDVDGGISIPGVTLSEGDGGGPPSRLPVLPLDSLTLGDLRIDAMTPAGGVAFVGDGAVESPEPRALDARLSGRLSHAAGAADLTFEGAVDTEGAINGSVTASADRLAGNRWQARGAEAWVSVGGHLGAVQTLDGVVSAEVVGIGRVGTDTEILIDTPSVLVSGSGGVWPDTLLARARLADGDSITGRAALDLSLADPNDGDGMPDRFAAELSFDLNDADQIVDTIDLDIPFTAGRSSLVLALHGSLADWRTTISEGRWPEGMTDGRLSLDLVEVRSRSDGRDAPVGSLSLAGDLAIDSDGARLAGTEPWRIAPPFGSGPLDGVSITIAPDAETPHRLAWRRNDDAVAMAGRLTVPLDEPPLTGTVDATLHLRDPGSPRLEIAGLTVESGAVPLAGDRRIGIGRLDLSGDGWLGDMAARVEASLDLDETVPEGMSASGLSLDTAAAVSWRDDAVSLRPDDCVTLAARSLRVGEIAAVSELAPLCLRPVDDDPLLTLRLPDPDSVARLVVSAAIEAAGVTGEVAGLGAVSGDLPDATVQGEMALAAGAGDPGALAISWRDGALAATGPGVATQGLAGTATIRAFGDPRLTAEFAIDRLAMTATPSPVVPLRLTGTAEVPADGPITAEASATGAAGALTAALDLRHDRATGQGQVEIAAEPISLAPGVRQPGDLLPVLSGLPVDAVTGTVSGLSAWVTWGDGTTSTGQATLSDLTIEAPYGTITGIDGTLTASSLAPLRLPAGQRLTADSLAVGLQLGEGEAEFGLSPGMRLSVSSLGFDWAGGRLSAEPFNAVLDDPTLQIVLAAQGVDLSRLATQLPLSNFEATGTLQGRVPVRLTPDTIAIEDARLETVGPGVIRYRPNGAAERPPAGGLGGQPGGVDLLMAALENFNYDSLVLTLNGRTGEDLIAGIEIDGANPDLYDGWPIDLNVDVSGALIDILRSGLRSMSIGGRTQDIIERELNR